MSDIKMYENELEDLWIRLLGTAIEMQIANLNSVGNGKLVFMVDGKKDLPIPINNTDDLFHICAAIAIMATR